MQPVRLQLHNFTSYADETVELEGVQLAALVGQNGAGKSSLLDALTWCLFGEGTKGRSLDNYVRRGEQEARVAVDFELHGQTYRVIRHRAAAKGKTLLDLFQADSAGGWTPLSSRTIAETQTAIEQLLRMDYRTFTASSLILQGRADALTSDMTDQERKEVLARILGLDLWDKLQERAREEARGARARVSALAEQAARAEAKAADLPKIEERIVGEKGAVEAAEAAVSLVATQVSDLEGQLAQRPMLEQQTRDLQSQLESRVSDLQRLADDIEQAQQEMSQQQEALIKRSAIEASLPQVEIAESSAIETLERIAAAASDLERRLAGAERDEAQSADISRQVAARDRDLRETETNRHRIAEKLQDQAQIMAMADQIRDAAQRSTALQRRLDEMDDKGLRYQELDRQCVKFEAQASAWGTTTTKEITTLQTTLGRAEEQARVLNDVPCGGTDLQPQCQLLISARRSAATVEQIRRQLDDLSTAENPNMLPLQAARRQRDELEYDPAEHAEVRRELASLRSTAALLPSLEAAQQQAEDLRERHHALALREQALRDEIHGLRQLLQKLTDSVTGADDLRAQLARTKRDLAAARAIEASARERVARLAQALEEATANEVAARQRIAALESRVIELKGRREQLRQEIGALQDRLAETGRALAVMVTVAGELATARSALQTWRQEEAAAREAIGRLRQELSDLQAAAREAEETRARVTIAEHQALVYETLDQAAGKKSGVPALIVEAAVPQVESLANDLLGRMAGGRLAVRLDTQAETKAGTLQEVLRIMVLEQGAERPYVTFSGAERFMVDLALRIALSKFLAHRAGAEIQLLVLDEGIGAADPANRQAIVQALFEASKEFAKVLVISHLDEVKDAFPQRIEVYRTPEGSKVKIA